MAKNKAFQEFADKLKEIEDKKRQLMKFCDDHKFEHEKQWIRREVHILSEIRMEMEMIADGHRNPSEATFIDL